MTVAEALARSGIDAREARLLLARRHAGSREASARGFARTGTRRPTSRTLFLEFTERRRARRAGRLHPRPQGVLRPASLRSIRRCSSRGRRPSCWSIWRSQRRARIGARPGHRPRRDRARDEAPAGRKRGSSRSDADLSRARVAQRNAVKLGLEVEFRHGRWFEPVARRALRL